jgi:hypothetical protein
MHIFRLSLIFLAVLMIVACSRKPTASEDSKLEEVTGREAPAERAGESDSIRGSTERAQDEKKSQPEEQDIGEDSVAFLRSTVAKRADSTPGDCPGCPSSAGQIEVLRFLSAKVERIVAGASSCEVTVRIRAMFNPSHGGIITGGLVGWIPAEQKDSYSRGESPAGEQAYEVKVIYHKTEKGWERIEFDRSSS